MKKGLLTTEFWVGLGSGTAILEAGMTDPDWQVRCVALVAVAVISAAYAISRANVKAQEVRQ